MPYFFGSSTGWTSSPAGRSAVLDLAYLTRGLSWSADYVATLPAASEERMDLGCYATVTNRTGHCGNTLDATRTPEASASSWKAPVSNTVPAAARRIAIDGVHRADATRYTTPAETPTTIPTTGK